MKLTALQVRRLLDKLCSKQGFCLPPEAVEALANNPPEEVLAFTDEIFRGEGLDPFRADSAIYRGVRDVVAAAFHRATLVVSDDE